jgi:hypothetical protein
MTGYRGGRKINKQSLLSEAGTVSDQITVSVDLDVADAYRLASDVDRRKLDLLVNLRLRDATQTKASLKDVMLDISQHAQQRGLTPEALKSMLDE